MTASRAPLRSLDEALDALLAQAAPLPAEWVSTFDADGRVLAEDLVASLQVPWILVGAGALLVIALIPGKKKAPAAVPARADAEVSHV